MRRCRWDQEEKYKGTVGAAIAYSVPNIIDKYQNLQNLKKKCTKKQTQALIIM